VEYVKYSYDWHLLIASADHTGNLSTQCPAESASKVISEYYRWPEVGTDDGIQGGPK